MFNVSAILCHIDLKNKERDACKQVFLTTVAIRIKLFHLHYLFLEFGWIFLALNEVWERKLLSCAFCSSSAGEDIWLDWKLLCVLCLEEQWGIGLHWCGWRQYHPAPSGHIKVCLADGLDRGCENRGLFLISIRANCFTNRIFKALDCKSY